MSNKSGKDKDNKPYFKASLLNELVTILNDFDIRIW